jgi:MerR family transcriptional regulator/heat shock protein HspR
MAIGCGSHRRETLGCTVAHPGDLYVTVRVAPHVVFRREGDDLHMVVPIAIHEAALGAKIDIHTPDGQAKLRVPPGTQSGQRFRLREHGAPSTRTGQRGDLIVETRIMLPKCSTNAQRNCSGNSAASTARTCEKRDVAKRAERGKAYYMISAVSQKYDIHPQTLRLYEREGLLKPSRTEGNTRLYSEEDLEQLETILTLTRDLGVNLAGVEIILNLRRKIEQMQGEVNQFMDYVKREMARGIDDWEQRLGTGAREVHAHRSRPAHAASVRDEERRREPQAPDQSLTFVGATHASPLTATGRGMPRPYSDTMRTLVGGFGPVGCQPRVITSKSLAVSAPNAGLRMLLSHRVSKVPLMYMSDPLSATISP